MNKKDYMKKGYKCEYCYRLKQKYCECTEGNYRQWLSKDAKVEDGRVPHHNLTRYGQMALEHLSSEEVSHLARNQRS